MTGAGIGLLAVIVLLVAAATSILWPLRSARAPRARDQGDVALKIARDSKLGEINDLELDFRLGKLSAADYQALKSTLRFEALEIIRAIDSSAEASNGAGSIDSSAEPCNGAGPRGEKP